MESTTQVAEQKKTVRCKPKLTILFFGAMVMWIMMSIFILNYSKSGDFDNIAGCVVFGFCGLVMLAGEIALQIIDLHERLIEALQPQEQQA